VKARWAAKAEGTGNLSQAQKERLKKLAGRMDALAEKDEKFLERAREIASLRQQGATELYAVCADFVRDLNDLLTHIDVGLDPEEYGADSFHENTVNLFQMNARGRILQIRFEATAELISTEEFRVPYILEGAVRCFNQQLLDQDLIEEQLLFYTLEKGQHSWRFFDPRTYRSGRLDADYFISLMEQLV
jgi:hypothetical protein